MLARLRFSLAPVALLACLLVPAGAAARPKPLLPKTHAHLRAAPPCSYFSATVAGWGLGISGPPHMTTITQHHTLCSWSGQLAGKYAAVVTVAVFPAPAFLGRAEMGVARRSAEKAERSGHGLGIYLTGPSARRGIYFQSLATWGEESPDTETGKCPFAGGLEGAGEYENKAIEKNQSGPQCAGQPGTEGDFGQAYGSPRGKVEAMLVQINVACEQNAFSELTPGRTIRAFFASY